ncbi:MAG: hypothetical protein ACOC8K_07455, partial [Gemmatimonadota bacterium]
GMGMVSYLVASYGGFAYPFLLSLALSLATYLAGSFWGPLRGEAQKATTPSTMNPSNSPAARMSVTGKSL